MMSENEKKVPKRRFKDFENVEAWEQRKFSDDYKVCAGYAFKYQDYTDKGITIINGESIQHGNVDSTKFNYLPEYFREEYSKFLLQEGDIVVGLNRPITDGNLKISRIPKCLGGSLLYQRAGKIKHMTNIDADFSFVLLEKEILKHTLKEAVGSDQPFISTSKLDEWKMFLPKSEEERKKNGAFFKHLDNLIAVHQRKLEKTKALKKAYLTKMFPAEGERKPKLRFAGFTDDWEQRKLGELAGTTYGGGTPNTSTEEYWNGRIPWIQSSDLCDGELANVKPKKYISNTGLNKSATKIVPQNSIAIITRVGVGKLALMPFAYTTSQDFLSMSKLKINEVFGVYSIYKKLQGELNSVQGTSIKGITKDELLAKVIRVPNDDNEQKQIGAFFANLDNLITLHQRKLEKLQNIKKAYLNEMFI